MAGKRFSLWLAGALLLALAVRLQAEPELLLPENLKAMGCAAPDTRFMFVRSSQPGNGLALHPYWENKPGCGVRWALGH